MYMLAVCWRLFYRRLGCNTAMEIGAVCACLYVFIMLRLRSKAVSIYSILIKKKSTNR
ncbi:hypothetical protein LY85_0691 [Clostridium sp. KNHs216]|nr:hypothetical protein LY85_0691 [Clostridium sp. KNHs216]